MPGQSCSEESVVIRLRVSANSGESAGFPCNLFICVVRRVRNRSKACKQERDYTTVYEASVQGSIIVVITLLLTFLQPAYANGGHMHLGGIFFLLLGGLVFVGGFFVVFYLLLRPGSGDTEENEYD